MQFRGVRNRLLLSYLIGIAIILGAFAAVVYYLVEQDRNQQLDRHLRQVAGAAADTLELIKHEYAELITEEEYKGYIPRQPNGAPLPITTSELMEKYRLNSNIKIASHSLFPALQAVEWYDERRQLMVREGDLLPPKLGQQAIAPQGVITQAGKIRSFTLPVYSTSASGKREPIGYARASESTATLDAELYRLRWSLGVGGLAVAGLTAVGGILMVRASLKPIVASFAQLRQFTADASHELRNPLTAIRASVAVMQSHPERIHPADVEKLRAIASAAAQMSQLVDDLLLLARMDRQASNRQDWQTIPLDELLEDLIALFSDRAERSGIVLSSALITDVFVCGDAAQLQRLLANLLANALQYTPSGGRVTVAMQRWSDRVAVSIQDTGIGIAACHLPFIFDRFWRADPARSQYEGGSGLGLAIAKAIAQQHQGEIKVESELGAGSCFQIRLPIANRYHSIDPG